jgi:hypothetical protein
MGSGAVLDQADRKGARLVELPHVAKDADRADHPPVSIAEGGGVQGGGDNLAGGAARIEDRVPCDAVLHDLIQCGHEFARLFRGDDA